MMAGLKNFCDKISYRYCADIMHAAATSSSIYEIAVDLRTGKENVELSLREFILLDVFSSS